MCGIFGYVGAPTDAGSMVLDALRKLEYRGYDSWGVGVGVNGHVAIEKNVGKIGSATVDFPDSTIGFGHTRWATHGGVTRANAHPHSDPTGRFAVIHNGIIENFASLRAQLEADGKHLASETDTEVVVHLIASQIQDSNDPQVLIEAVANTFRQLAGFNAIIVLDRGSETLTAAKNVSPLVIGRGSDGIFIASDQLALNGHVDEIAFPEDGQIVQLSHKGVVVFDSYTMKPETLCWRTPSAQNQSTELAGFPDFLLKEIYDQPAVVRRIATEMIDDAERLAHEIRESYGTFLIGCGTASYAALAGSYLFSRIARRHVNFVVGSEFTYHEHFLTDRSLVCALSQSGETIDIIQSVLAAKSRGARIAALVNVEGSTLDRIADFSVHLQAGPELSVLSTKAYSAKVALLSLTAHILDGRKQEGVDLLLRAADAIEQSLRPDFQEKIHQLGSQLRVSRSLFAIGRGLNFPTALESALKIKEVSYIHAEGFAAGELKHGVIALIEEGTPCIAFAPNDETHTDIISGAMELKSRGGFIIGVSPMDDPVFDVHLPVADVGNASPLAMVVPAQLLGRELAVARGLDPDKPRNLAKSVTVK
ncbi:MAG TPA: glutamine--fructose-6-phosphate transaminase (isomerizing) [Thermomicrobiales bacterium]|nr:glutamine--fructose-6-phosphate transaminase (isomerizing) [Thermomicrobiales bacterium]